MSNLNQQVQNFTDRSFETAIVQLRKRVEKLESQVARLMQASSDQQRAEADRLRGYPGYD